MPNVYSLHEYVWQEKYVLVIGSDIWDNNYCSQQHLLFKTMFLSST